MKLNAKCFFALPLYLLIHFSGFSQSPLQHNPQIYQDTSNLIYVKTASPVYLFVSTQPEASNAKLINQPSKPLRFKEEGKHTIKHFDDKQKVHSSLTLQADGSTPTSKYAFNREAEYQAGTYRYYNKKVDISFEANDKLSGINAIYYSLDGKSYKEYSNPVTLRKEKSYKIQYYAVDNVGNIEKSQEIDFEIDLTAPKSEHLIVGDRIDNIYSPRTTISLSSKDQGAGVENIFWEIDNQPQKVYDSPILLEDIAEGDHKIKYYGVDAVGNKENLNTISFFLDKSPPIIADDVLGDQYFKDGNMFVSARTQLKLTVIDNKAGVRNIKYKLNNEEYQDYKTQFNLAKQSGKVTITSYAVDRINNSNQSNSPTLGKGKRIMIVDPINPKLGFSFEGTTFKVSDTTFVSPETKIILSASDEESGLKSLRYHFNSEKEQVYTNPFSLDQEGLYQIVINGEDQVANKSQQIFYCKVDTTGPILYPRFSIDPIKNLQSDNNNLAVYSPQVMLFLAATDQMVGYDKMFYSINGGEEKRYGEVLRDFKKGEDYEIMIKAVDKLGNETIEMIRFSVKK